MIVSFFATKQSMQTTSSVLIFAWVYQTALVGVIVMPMLFIESLSYDSQKLCCIIKVSKCLFLYGIFVVEYL